MITDQSTVEIRRLNSKRLELSELVETHKYGAHTSRPTLPFLTSAPRPLLAQIGCCTCALGDRGGYAAVIAAAGALGCNRG